MDIFIKGSELFYWRPKKLASNSACVDRDQHGDGLAADYCKRALDYQVCALNWRQVKDKLDIVSVDAGVLAFAKVRAGAADALIGCYNSIYAHKSEFYNGARRLTFINCKILRNTSVLM